MHGELILPTMDARLLETLKASATAVTSAQEAVESIQCLEKVFALQPNCLGLAAPQICISKQVSIIRNRKLGIGINLINPVILETGEPMLYNDEGCMSFPRRRFSVPRFRTLKIKTHYLLKDATGNISLGEKQMGFSYDLTEKEWGGIVCVAVQHEIDHLTGVCLPWKDGASETPYKDDGVRLQGATLGRNDPCPCGAKKPDGKPIKFKNCCMLVG